MEARGVELEYGQLALTVTNTYRHPSDAHEHAWTKNASNHGAYANEGQRIPALQGFSALGGGYCHNLFPMLSPIPLSIP